jgi:CubicO group peptidase (beta-lactamase class C family)
MFIAAGLVIEEVTGHSWDEFVTQRLLRPLGMMASNTSVGDLRGLDNVSTPHIEVDGWAKTVPWRTIDNAGPAGSINSNVVDMAQWVKLHLASGESDGEQLISAANVVETHTSEMVIPLTGLWGLVFPESDFLTYGMGWFLADYRSRKMVNHGGNIDGNTAFVTMMPEENLGIVVLSNLNGANAFISALSHHIYDRMLGGGEKDWHKDQLATWTGILAQQADQAKARYASRTEGTTTSLSIEQYAGTYTHNMYDDVVVAYHNGVLTARFAGVFEAELEHWHYDTFRVRWTDPTMQGGAPELMRFELGSDGKPAVLHTEIEGRIPFVRSIAEGAH